MAAFRPGPSLPPLAGKRTAGSCRRPTKRRVHVSRDARTPLVPAMGTPPASAWSAGEVPGPTHDRSCLPPFSHPLSRCDLLSSHLPLLCLWCVEGTSSAQRTSSVLSLHRPTLHGEDETKGGRTAHRIMLQGRTPGSGGHHSTEGRCQQASCFWNLLSL